MISKGQYYFEERHSVELPMMPSEEMALSLSKLIIMGHFGEYGSDGWGGAIKTIFHLIMKAQEEIHEHILLQIPDDLRLTAKVSVPMQTTTTMKILRCTWPSQPDDEWKN